MRYLSRRCSRSFTGLSEKGGTVSRSTAHILQVSVTSRRSSKIALFVSSCVSAFSLLLPSAHSACCQVKSLDISFVIYTISPPFVKYPFVIFSQYVWKTHPHLFPVPPVDTPVKWMHLPPLYAVVPQLSHNQTQPHRHALARIMQCYAKYLRGLMAEIIEGSYGCENSIIYVMVTAPPLFSAPRVRVWASASGSGLGLRFGVWPLGQRVRSGWSGLSNFSRWLQRHAKNPYFADGILFLLHLPPAIHTLTIVCLIFGSLNRYFAHFASDPDLILSIRPWSRQPSRQIT